MNLLLTGGTGYIGSHAAAVMVEAGHQVILFDNLSNSKLDVVQRLEKITGKTIPFIQGDVRDTVLLEKTLRDFKVDGVIHFAGLKAVAESVKYPIDYYANNVQGSISLLQAMRTCNVKTIVFSSSATVYGEPQYLPYDERHPTNPVNPYGRTKLQVEQILKDQSESDPEWRITILRYFNPVGAHDSGLIGENPVGTPNNLMPFLLKVASGKSKKIFVFGGDYPTRDGSAERDYIHVMDLVDGHLAALNYLENHKGFYLINLGTGRSYTVLEVISSFEVVTGIKIPFEIANRRDGDLPAYYSSSAKVQILSDWAPFRSLEQICLSAWNFQIKNIKDF